MKVFGIILNYKTPEMTLEAARGLARALEPIPDSRFVIVDNDSGDGSLERITEAVAREPWRDRCDVVASGHNGGFGYGQNFGMRLNLASDDKAEFFYLLNSDAIPEPDAVVKLLEFMEGHRDAGMAGSYIRGMDGHFHNTAFRFPTLISEFAEQANTAPIAKALDALLGEVATAMPESDRTLRVDWTAAVSMMIRRKAIEEIGLFDETFFLYFEETDLCFRARKAGYSVYYVRESVVAHIGSASTGMKDATRRMPGYWFASRQHYFRTHHGDRYLLATNVAWVAGRSIRELRRLVRPREEVRRTKLVRDFITFNFLKTPSRTP